eukprot:30835-Pelagococcus_subviridis.AAC.23
MLRNRFVFARRIYSVVFVSLLPNARSRDHGRPHRDPPVRHPPHDALLGSNAQRGHPRPGPVVLCPYGQIVHHANDDDPLLAAGEKKPRVRRDGEGRRGAARRVDPVARYEKRVRAVHEKSRRGRRRLDESQPARRSRVIVGGAGAGVALELFPRGAHGPQVPPFSERVKQHRPVGAAGRDEVELRGRGDARHRVVVPEEYPPRLMP